MVAAQAPVLITIVHLILFTADWFQSLMRLPRQCFNIPLVCKGFCQALQQTSSSDRVYNLTQPIVRKSISGWVKMIEDVNEEGGKKQTSGNISGSGSNNKRSWQSEEKDGESKRAKLEPDKGLNVGGIKQEAELKVPKCDDTSLIICFDLELADGSFASEIFQVCLHPMKLSHTIIVSFTVTFADKSRYILMFV